MREKIIKCIKKVKGDFFNQEAELISEGWIDSFELISLVDELEKEFDIVIPMNKVFKEDFDNVDNISKLIREL